MTTYNPDTQRSLRDDDDAPHTSQVTPGEDARTILINKVAWGAVLAGVVVSLVTQLVLNMIGIGIGAATIDPGTGDNPAASTLTIGAGIWWTLSGILAALVGGYAAGRMSGKPKPGTAAWHGLTTWALTTLMIFYLLTTAVGGILGGALSTVASAVGGVGRAAGATLQTAAQVAAPQLAGVTDPFAAIEQGLRGAGANDPAAARDAAIAAVRNLVSGAPAQAQAARDRAAEAVARAQNIPPDQARQQVAQYEQQYRQAVDQAKAKAVEAADATARTVSRGALLAALSLLLGAVAGWFGGRMGAVDPTVTLQAWRASRS